MSQDRDEKQSMWERIMERFGFPTLVAVVLFLLGTGAIGSPITENRDLIKQHVAATADLTTEIRKIVRLQSLLCVKQVDPSKCTMALTEAPATNTVMVVK